MLVIATHTICLISGNVASMSIVLLTITYFLEYNFSVYVAVLSDGIDVSSAGFLFLFSTGFMAGKNNTSC